MNRNWPDLVYPMSASDFSWDNMANGITKTWDNLLVMLLRPQTFQVNASASCWDGMWR